MILTLGSLKEALAEIDAPDDTPVCIVFDSDEGFETAWLAEVEHDFAGHRREPKGRWLPTIMLRNNASSETTPQDHWTEDLPGEGRYAEPAHAERSKLRKATKIGGGRG